MVWELRCARVAPVQTVFTAQTCPAVQVVNSAYERRVRPRMRRTPQSVIASTRLCAVEHSRRVKNALASRTEFAVATAEEQQRVAIRLCEVETHDLANNNRVVATLVSRPGPAVEPADGALQ